MNRAHQRNWAILRILGAVGIVAAGSGAGVACSASSDGPGTPETKEPTSSVYTTADGEYQLISTVNDPVLVGRWRFNEFYSTTQSLYDSSNNDNTGFRGSIFGSDPNDPTRTAQGTGSPGDLQSSTGRALLFSGAPPTHDFCTVPSSEGDFSALEPNKVSVEAWIKTTMTGTGYIVSKGAEACTAPSYGLYVSGGSAKFLVKTAGSVFRESPGKVVNDDSWHHLLGTFDGTTVRLYVDGNAVGAGTSGATENIKYGLSTHNNLYFGAYNADPTLVQTACQLPFTGAIDNVLVWRNALNADEAKLRFQGADLPPRDDDKDGVPNSLDECPDTPAGATVNSVGCTVTVADSDKDGVPNDIDRCDHNDVCSPAYTQSFVSTAADGCNDIDHDGVSDEPRDFTCIVRDVCPTGTVGARSARGCSCTQVRDIIEGSATIAPATGLEPIHPCPEGGTYRTHGAYVSCVSRALEYLLDHRVVRQACADSIQEDAAHSDIGR